MKNPPPFVIMNWEILSREEIQNERLLWGVLYNVRTSNYAEPVTLTGSDGDNVTVQDWQEHFSLIDSPVNDKSFVNHTDNVQTLDDLLGDPSEITVLSDLSDLSDHVTVFKNTLADIQVKEEQYGTHGWNYGEFRVITCVGDLYNLVSLLDGTTYIIKDVLYHDEGNETESWEYSGFTLQQSP